MDEKTLTLPQELLATYELIARRQGRPEAELMLDALWSYADREAKVTTSPSWIGSAESTDAGSNGSASRFASLGVAESPDDGFDSTNHEEWLRQHWMPD